LAKFKGLIGVNSSEVYKRESRLLVFQRETIIFSQRESSFLVFQRESSFLVFQRETIIFSQRERGILSFEENTFFDKLVCTL